ncbi:unnamed protein product [Spirodela intermedia]|uniref:Uncharacterized protein n=2 Tax=Spirodela intermedia TaxID=51605 RepID=A0A7I8JHD6_SPIIN|nr:unnamed protein product [Spirodela intermedia]CAA6669548.1 unnamed protein product [Spirodela intermedia]CAA7406517.1 unnamed protein product [Spirodela intermedia]
MLTRLFSPVLIPRRCQLPIGVSVQSRRPISSMVPSTRRFFSDHGIFSGSRRFADMVSLTVRVEIRLSS